MEDYYCIGCGSKLQSNHPHEPGFVPQSKLGGDDVLCKRCFRITHYNDVLPASLTSSDYEAIIDQIAHDDALIVMIVDAFDIEGSMLPQLLKRTNHQDVIVLINKIDLLPKNVSTDYLLHRFKQIISQNNIRPLETIVMSAKETYQIKRIMDAILNHATTDHIYIVGATNVGKSTFINALLKQYTEAQADVITVSKHAGTTLNIIEIPLGDYRLFDTPGLIHKKQYGYVVDDKTAKAIAPTKRLSPVHMSIQSGQSILFGGLLQLDYPLQSETGITIYMSPEIHIHKTKTSNVMAYKDKNLYTRCTPPFLKKDALIFKTKQMVFPKDQAYDLVIPGLGFITIKGPVEFIVHIQQDVTPYIRKALL